MGRVGLPNAKDAHAELIKKFSKKTKAIRIHRVRKNCFFVEFESPETMEANKEALESLQVNGEEVFVDYVGTKSKNPPGDKVEVPKAINPKKLYVANFNALVTKEVIQKAFKGCSTVDMPYSKKNIRSKRRFCFVYFEDESSAKQAFENAASINLGGK